MHSSTILPFLLPLAAAATNQLSLRDAPADLPHVTSIQYSGSGCPSSAPAVDKSGSWNDLSFRMNAFEVTLPGTDSTENCEVHIQASGCSAGWQVGVKDVYVQGHVILDPGAELDFYVQTYWSQSAAKTVSDPRTLRALSRGCGRRIICWKRITDILTPNEQVTVRGTIENSGTTRIDEVTTAHATIPNSRIVWSPCSTAAGDIGILNVNFRTALVADGDQYGYFGKGDGATATETFSYVWRTC
jgi:hypothetical protein